jgi:hypothetical protein
MTASPCFNYPKLGRQVQYKNARVAWNFYHALRSDPLAALTLAAHEMFEAIRKAAERGVKEAQIS